MNDKTIGIVINTTDYKDNDAIISVYTKEFDIISLYVKGYKKITSKNVYATQLLDISEFLFDYDNTNRIHILKSATLIDENLALKQDYDKLSIASTMLEIVNSIKPEGYYEYLKQSLDLLKSTNQIYTVFNLFLVKILNDMGLAPNVDCCVICDNMDGIETISVDDGGFVCRNCNRELHLPLLGVDLLKNFRYVNKASYDVIEKLYPLKTNNFQITDILIKFFTTYMGINLKSYKNLVNLNK